MTLGRRSFAGGAPATTLTGDITDTSLSIGVDTIVVDEWPDVATGPFIIRIDRGLSSEEAVLVSGLSTTTLTVPTGGRGQCGTNAQPHSASAVAVHTPDPDSMNDVDDHVYNIGRDDHPQYLKVTDIVSVVGPLLYPVGSLFCSTVSTNPGTLLGFGTWAAYAAGQTLIGVGSFTDGSGNSQTVTSGQQLGEFEHLLTSGETGTTPHGHGWTDAGHVHPQYPGDGSGGSGYVGGPSGALYGSPANNTGNNNVAVGSVNNATAASASSSHNNIQPSIGVYIWQRTA